MNAPKPLNPNSFLPEQKNVYHSHVSAACGKAPQGKLFIQLLGEPRDSQYPGKPAFVKFAAWNDTLERSYSIENPQIRALLERAPQNVGLWMQAVGGKDSAVVELWDQNGNRIGSSSDFTGVTAPAPAAAPSFGNAPAPAVAPQPSGNGFGATSATAPLPPAQSTTAAPGTFPAPAAANTDGFPKRDERSLAAVWIECFSAALFIISKLEHLHADNRDAVESLRPQELATSLFIEYNRKGGNCVIVPPREPKPEPASQPAAPLPPNVNSANTANAPAFAAAGPPNPGRPWDPDDDDLPF